MPAPDRDGLWFRIDFHDRASTLQIHAQPLVATRIEAGEKEAFLLIREGASTKKVEALLWEIVKRRVSLLVGGKP